MNSAETKEIKKENNLSFKEKIHTILSLRKRHLACAVAVPAMILSDLFSSLDKHSIPPTPHDTLLRDRLPEPFDYFDHTGNFAASIYGGGLAAYFVTRYLQKNKDYPMQRAKNIGMVVGATAVASLNAMVELKLGLPLDSLVSPNSHASDTTDFAYGLVAGAIGVYSGLEIYKGRAGDTPSAK